MSILRAFFGKELRGRLVRIRMIRDDSRRPVELGIGQKTVRMGEAAGAGLALAAIAAFFTGFGLLPLIDVDTQDRIFGVFIFLSAVTARTRGDSLAFVVISLLPPLLSIFSDWAFGFGVHAQEYFHFFETWALLGTTLSIYVFREACTVLYPSPVSGANLPAAGTTDT